ncbi:MAG TPA: T9SS type A sorting domain-containing protein [Ignavibacteria bacterium]|nr:T9SS type A sorting domain-containing protein [Ignavibacteria bacterium]
MKKIFNIFLFSFYTCIPLSNLYSQWILTGNLNGGYVNSILTSGNEMYAATSSQGVFRSDDSGTTWTQINSGLGNFLFVQSLAVKDSYIFAGTSSGGVFYTSNNGLNWIQSNSGLGQLNIKALISDSNNIYAGLIFAGIFRSVNNGSSWSRYGLGEGDLLNSISYDYSNFFVGLNGGIYRSSNNGVNWISAYNGITNTDVRCIVQNGAKTYCGTFGGGVFVSENNGVFWIPLSNGLTDQKILTLRASGNNLLAGTNSRGVFLLNSNTELWIPVNEGLTDTVVSSIGIKDNFVYIGSATGKIWKRSLSEIITDVKAENSVAPEKFHLFQNYPNPFNPQTKISFYIPEKTFVTLKIFDNLGREISELYSGELSSGTYTKYWNAENYPSGIYYYRLQSEFYSETKKLVLSK